jgi:tetratricopeptide (TPR) repeat protein
LIERAVRSVPRLTESILGQQEAALRELLRKFREGKTDEALERALPLGEPGGRGGGPAGDANLPTHRLSYDLRDLLGGGGQTSVWLGGQNVQDELAAEYRKAAEAATARGDYRRAAFIYGKLLHDYRLAAAVLERGGLHHDAALLYLHKLADEPAAARAFEAAGEIDRALHLYRQRGEHELAGDLLRRAGEDDMALAEYRLAADALVARDNHLAAGDLLAVRAGRPDLAEICFRQGWAARPRGSALACLLRLAPLVAHHEGPRDLFTLLDDADEFFASPGYETQAGQFYNELTLLADRPHLAAVRDDLRDRALVALAGKLRQRAAEGGSGAAAVSLLLGQSGRWPAALVRDADAALRGPPRPRKAAVTRIPTRPGRVSAVAAAAETGVLYLGFASGDVVCFDLRTGAQVVLPHGPGAVTALATDSSGRRVLVVRARDEEMGHLSGHTVQAGAVQPGAWRPLLLEGEARLTPIHDDGEGLVGLWNGATLRLLSGPDFLPIVDVSALLEFDLSDFRAGFLLPSPGRCRLALVAGGRLALFAVKFVRETGFGQPVCVPCGDVEMPWRPGMPAGCSLEAPPLSWGLTGPRVLELAGASPEGLLFWSAAHLSTAGQVGDCESAFSGDDHYRAAALLGPGAVAGVTRSAVHWLRGGARLRVRGTSSAELGDAVACFASPTTAELLVVGATGDVVRVPLPT